MSMQSRFPGKCVKCGRQFPAGTEIEMLGKGKAAHVNCDSQTCLTLAYEETPDMVAARLGFVMMADEPNVNWPERCRPKREVA